MDLFNNEIVSYKISRSNDLQLVLDTVKRACKKRDVKGTLLHSDKGFQYTSKQYNKLIQSYGITQSMSRKGNCFDNAAMECFLGHFKSELMYINKFKEDEEVLESVSRYIEFYNTERFQSKLNNLTPIEYRRQAKIT